MNHTIQELLRRKSVRIFLDKPIEEEKKKWILESASQAPTAGNMQLYSILDIQDDTLKGRLAELCDNQPFIAKAKLVLVFVSNPLRWYRNYNRFITKAANDKPSLADYYLALGDAFVAAQNAVTAAESYGIGSCYIGDIVENVEEVKALLHLPKGVVPLTMVVFGYPSDQQILRIKPTRFYLDDVVFTNTFPARNDDEVLNPLIRRLKVAQHIDDDKIALKKAVEQIKFMYRIKQDTPFFREMNRSLQIIMKEFSE